MGQDPVARRLAPFHHQSTPICNPRQAQQTEALVGRGMMLEWLQHGPTLRDMRKMAQRVVTDAEYRAQLISDDPDLPLLWKRH